jgi:hypothetical protein
MRRASDAATSPWTWVLAAALLVLIDFGLTRTPFLWSKTDLWTGEGIGALAFWQTYDVARKVYRPRPAAAVRVALIGNSMMWFPAREPYLQRELGRVAPGLDARVDNLSFFGAHIGDMEIVSRLVGRLDPTLVVIGLGGSEIVPSTWGELVNRTGRFLEVGWRGGPLPETASETVNRWLKTAWPLYRFRTYARYVIRDRVFPSHDDRSFPDHFASSAEFFTFIHGRRGLRYDAAYRRFEQEPTLENLLDYLHLRYGGAQVLNEPSPDPALLRPDSPGVRTLDAMLERLAGSRARVVVLLMPENPLLEADREGLYHRPGFSDRAAEIIRAVAVRHGVAVVDGRRWMPPTSFVDLVHLMPDLGGFQKPLVEMILEQSGIAKERG